MSRRVVVTGMGAITPLGATAEETWQRLKDGKSGIRSIEDFDASGFATRFAGQIINLPSLPPQWAAARARWAEADLLDRKTRLALEDAARRAGKAVELRLDGDHLQIPREVAAALGDPLVHMLRNPVDHGVEAPEERRGAGKPSAAPVQISARQEGGALIVEIGDDGRGLNRAAILRRARERGLLDAGEAPDEATLFGLIFAPGFSTAQAVTDLSGRGVGMDVVRTSVESVGGHIEVESRPGRGSTFRILVPTA